MPVRHFYIITGWQANHQPFSTQLTGFHHHHFEKTLPEMKMFTISADFLHHSDLLLIFTSCAQDAYFVPSSCHETPCQLTRGSWDISASQHLWDRNSYPKRSPKQWPGEERGHLTRDSLLYKLFFYPKKPCENWKFFCWKDMSSACDQWVLFCSMFLRTSGSILKAWKAEAFLEHLNARALSIASKVKKMVNHTSRTLL